MRLSVGIGLNKFDEQTRRLVGDLTSPYRETISRILHKGYAKKSLIVQAGAFVAMARRNKPHIVGITLKRAVIHNRHLAKRTPAHETVGKLKRTVLDHLGIKSAVGSIIYIFKKEAIHGRGNIGSGLVDMDVKLYHIILDSSGRQCRPQHRQKADSYFHKRIHKSKVKFFTVKIVIFP